LRLPSVVVDPHQLETSILNLAVNSRDAMPGGGTMLISAATMQLAAGNPYDLPPGAYVALSVEDDGTGMDDETLGRAIDPFLTTKGVGKGSGLGLSMVHGFAQQLDGALRLESREGVGTKATIVLPAMETVAAREDEQIIPAVAKAANALKVLAVDDDFLVLMNIASMLQDLGHEVREAASGPEALEILRQEGPFDLLITDQAMPKMTGAELIEQVRVRQPDMPIIMASGYAEIPGGAPVGILRLSKPFNQCHLSDAIAQAVRSG
jgi:CheY-like chemotaxis protein